MSDYEPQNIPLGLYVHIPWCARKCPYCDFNSHELTEPPWSLYVDALLADLDAAYKSAGKRPIVTVFFGGGTPSLMPGQEMARLLDGIKGRVEVQADAEITLEANPGTVDSANFEAYVDGGINRLSIGAQSFRDSKLHSLGRIHSQEAIGNAIAVARAVGFFNINLDLMHSLPSDEIDGFEFDLRSALELTPTHLSWYELTYETGTAFARKPPARPFHEDIIEQHERGVALLEQANLRRYEVSAFALPGKECRHNLNYWEFGDYLGIGAGAHGKLSTNNGVFRTEKRKNPKSYMQDVVAKTEYLSQYELISDFMVNALRLERGFKIPLFEQRTGVLFREIAPLIDEAVQRGLLLCDRNKIVPTQLGYRFLNDLQMLFVEAA